MNRRELIAGAAVLPLAPLPAGGGEDPAVVAWRAYSAAREAASAAFWTDDAAGAFRPLTAALSDAEDAAELRLCATLATTPAGLVCQARLALDLAELGAIPDDRDLTLLRSIVTGLERLA